MHSAGQCRELALILFEATLAGSEKQVSSSARPVGCLLVKQFLFNFAKCVREAALNDAEETSPNGG